MSNGRIRRLFFDKLKSGLKESTGELPWILLQEGIVISDETGEEYEPNDTNIRTHLIPAPAESETLQGDHVRYMGIYQMDVRILLDIETDLYGDANLVLEEISDELQRIFKINMRLSDPADQTNFTVQVLSPIKIREAKREGKTNWWSAYCYFDYRADTNI